MKHWGCWLLRRLSGIGGAGACEEVARTGFATVVVCCGGGVLGIGGAGAFEEVARPGFGTLILGFGGGGACEQKEGPGFATQPVRIVTSSEGQARMTGAKCV